MLYYRQNKEPKGQNGEHMNGKDLGYVIATDYLDVNSGVDVSDAIQRMIDENPMRTLYFPDGEYILAKPICTSARPERSVSFELSNYAIFRAASDWSDSEAMVRIGAAEPFNTIYTAGSNYAFHGGIIDGSGIANGIAIESGRETSIRNVSIKNTFIGLHIKDGANSSSSDADIDTVNIVCNNKKGSIGVLVVGFDNTLTNMRIAKAETGVKLIGSGNFLRNIHPLFIYRGECDYQDSCGFDDQSYGCWYDFCYSDNFAVGFKMKEQTMSVYQTCFCFWYSAHGGVEIGFKSEGRMNSIISKSKVSLRDDVAYASYLDALPEGGGRIDQPLFKTELNKNDAYKHYLTDEVIWAKR